MLKEVITLLDALIPPFPLQRLFFLCFATILFLLPYESNCSLWE